LARRPIVGDLFDLFEPASNCAEPNAGGVGGIIMFDLLSSHGVTLPQFGRRGGVGGDVVLTHFPGPVGTVPFHLIFEPSFLARLMTSFATVRPMA
jgi:hypothetical protein